MKDQAHLLALAAKEEQRRMELAYVACQATRTWHLVHTGLKSELVVQEKLEKRHGFEVYSPRMLARRRKPLRQITSSQRNNPAAAMQLVPEAIFKNYLLVRFDLLADPWHQLFNLEGVFGIACEGNMPAIVPQALVDCLKGLEVNGFVPGETLLLDAIFQQLTRHAAAKASPTPFAVGEQARVLDGVFEGLHGAVDEVDESGRVKLLLLVMGRKVPVEFTVEQLENTSRR